MNTSWLLGCALAVVTACVGCGGATEGQLGGGDPSPMPIAMAAPDAGSPEAAVAVTVDAGNAPEAAAVTVVDDAAPEAALEAAATEGGGEDAGVASDDGGLPPCPVPTASYAWVGIRPMVSMTGGYVPWPWGPNYQFPNGVEIYPWYYQDTVSEYVSSPPPDSALQRAPETSPGVFQFEGLPGAPIWIRTMGSNACIESPWLRFEIPADASAGPH
jgi:hypothetical protein